MMFVKDSWSVHIYCAMGIAVMTFGIGTMGPPLHIRNTFPVGVAMCTV